MHQTLLREVRAVGGDGTETISQVSTPGRHVIHSLNLKLVRCLSALPLIHLPLEALRSQPPGNPTTTETSTVVYESGGDEKFTTVTQHAEVLPSGWTIRGLEALHNGVALVGPSHCHPGLLGGQRTQIPSMKTICSYFWVQLSIHPFDIIVLQHTASLLLAHDGIRLCDP